ncbi:hypothetical protein [Desulfotruncus arcticus]|nr:hypothetical protein [Desulfotruncus arcticus]
MAETIGIGDLYVYTIFGTVLPAIPFLNGWKAEKMLIRRFMFAAAGSFSI